MDQKEIYTKIILKAAGINFDSKKLSEYKSAWWWNHRNKDQGGLRLTEAALDFIDNHAKIKTYKIDFPKEFSLTPQVLVWLDKFIESPYYITNKNITVMKEKDAFELYLFSGDVRKMGHNKALNKRLNQESTQV